MNNTKHEAQTPISRMRSTPGSGFVRSPFLAAFIILAFIPYLISNDYYLHIIILIFINVIYTSTYRFIHRAGQFHFGAHAYIGIGAYTSALLVTRLGFSFWIAMPLAGVIAGLLALVFGYPTLRLKGIYFAIVTWGIGDTLLFLYRRWKTLFGGNDGLPSIPGPDQINIPWYGVIDFSDKRHFFYLALILMLLSLYILSRLERSRFGLIFNGIREADSLSQSVGVNILNYKALAFSVCSGLAAIGGSFYAHYTYYICPKDFTIHLTLFLAIYMVVGGMGTYWGPIVGVVVLSILGEIFSGYAEYQMVMFSAFMVLALLFFPGGLITLPEISLSLINKWGKE